MKTALFVTDCSVDSALTLRNWITTQARQSICLTVVLPYDIDEGKPLDKTTLQTAKSAAVAQLKSWTILLGDAGIGTILTETLMASPELAISMHLLIRRYDYWFVEDWSLVTNTALSSVLNQASIYTVPLAINLQPSLVTV